MRIGMLKRRLLVILVAVAVTIAMAPVALMEPAHAADGSVTVTTAAQLQRAMDNGQRALIPEDTTIMVTQPVTVSTGSPYIIMSANSELQYSDASSQGINPVIKQTGGNLTIQSLKNEVGANVPADQVWEIKVLGYGGSGIEISAGTLVFDGPKLTLPTGDRNSSSASFTCGIRDNGNAAKIIINDGIFSATSHNLNVNGNVHNDILSIETRTRDVTVNDGEFIVDNSENAATSNNIAISDGYTEWVGKIVINKALFRNVSGTGPLFNTTYLGGITTGSRSRVYKKATASSDPELVTVRPDVEGGLNDLGNVGKAVSVNSLAVYRPISVDQLPSMVLGLNHSASFRANVNNGNNALTYAWKYDGIDIPAAGVTTSDYIIKMPGSTEVQNAIDFTNAGTLMSAKEYVCKVTDSRYRGYVLNANGGARLDVSASSSGTITILPLPDKAAGFALKSNTESSVLLKWSRQAFVSKYILEYGSVSKNMVNMGEYNVKYLTPGTSYTFRLTPVITFEGSDYPAATAVTLKVVTRPAKVSIVTPSTKSRTITVKWKKVKCSGYQVYIAKNSKFTKGLRKYTVPKSSTLYKKVTKLRKGTYYYVKVRAYKMNGSSKYYGKWSSVKKIKCR
jgi:hypothetical protein